MSKLVLQTPGLVLRPLERADLEPLCELYGDPEIRRYYPDGTRTREQTREELEWFPRGHPQHPGLGLLATIENARKKLGLHCQICLVMPGIDASSGVATKVGMHFERVWTDDAGPSHVYPMDITVK